MCVCARACVCVCVEGWGVFVTEAVTSMSLCCPAKNLFPLGED